MAIEPTDDNATTAPLNINAPTPAAPDAVAARGKTTSEHAMAYAAILLTALFGAGVIPTDGPIAKVAAVAAIVLVSLGYTVSRTLVKLSTILLVFVLGAGAMQLTACGASSRETTIRTTYAAANAATATFDAFSRAQEAKIVANAKDLEDGKAQLAAWRAKVAKVDLALDAVYRAISAAALLNTDQSTMALVAAALTLNQSLHDMGVTP